MKYKFQVMVAKTYKDEDIEAEIDLSDEEVKTMRSENQNKHQITAAIS